MNYEISEADWCILIRKWISVQAPWCPESLRFLALELKTEITTPWFTFFIYYCHYIPAGIVVLEQLCAGHWCSTDCAIVSEVLFTPPADNAFNESLTWNFVHASQSSTFYWWPAFTPHSTACKWMLCDIKFALALSRRLGPISSPRKVTRHAVTLNGLHRCARWAKRFWCILIHVHVTGSASGLLGEKGLRNHFLHGK